MCKLAAPTTVHAGLDLNDVVRAAGKRKKSSKEASLDRVEADRFRTKLCRNYEEKGSCPYESRCMFAHGAPQLRTKEMNLRDGLVSEEAIRQFKKLQQKPRSAQGPRAKQFDAECPLGVQPFGPISTLGDDEYSLCSRSNSDYCGASTSSAEIDIDSLDDDGPLQCGSAMQFVTPTRFRFNPYARVVAFP